MHSRNTFNPNRTESLEVTQVWNANIRSNAEGDESFQERIVLAKGCIPNLTMAKKKESNAISFALLAAHLPLWGIHDQAESLNRYVVKVITTTAPHAAAQKVDGKVPGQP